ncbi:MAG: LemA family protein [bacterium]|nr:LemA family protein [bacterium]
MDPLLIIGAVVLVLVVYLWFTYNNLVVLRERIKEALSQIDVQLKRRSDLIPNLIETVKGYAKHEREVFEKVTQARANMLKAETLPQKAEANNMMEKALKSIFAVAEAYPDLKASENFKSLQEELTDTENKISYSRQFYNSNVLAYNTSIKRFPGSIFANMFGFRPTEFFAATEEEKKEIKVKF